MKRAKPFYILGALIISIILLIGSFFAFSGFTKDKRDEAERNIIESILNSIDWDNFPWEDFPFDQYENFPWDMMPWDKVPWDNVPESFPWDKIPFDALPWNDLPEDFPWETYPWDELPDDFWDTFPWDKVPDDFNWDQVPFDRLPDTFDWGALPWSDLPENFPWNDVPWENMPEDFDWGQIPWSGLPEDFPWNEIPMENMPEDFDWNTVPWDKMPEDFDWNSVPWENMPEDFDWNGMPWDDLPDDFPWETVPSENLPDNFDWNNMPWDSMPEDFDWNTVPWESMPEDFDWNSVPWGDLPEDFPWERIPWSNLPDNFDWTKIPWEKMPPDFPWESVPWESMPDDFWETFPWDNLPEGFPWYVLPWLLINPDLIPDGVLPDDFYPWDCEHEFLGDGFLLRAPTCVTAGEKINFCIKCGQQVSEEIPATGEHTFGDDRVCSVCKIRKLLLRSNTQEKEYDGKLFTSEIQIVEEESAQLLAGHSVNYENAIFPYNIYKTGKAINVFYFANPIVSDSSGRNVTEQYYVLREYGTLEITPRNAVVGTRDRSKTFDNSVLRGMPEDVYSTDLAEGDSVDLTSLVFGEGITEIGRRPNELVSFRIINGNGADVTDCYSVKVQFGWLRVTADYTSAASSLSMPIFGFRNSDTALVGAQYVYSAKNSLAL